MRNLPIHAKTTAAQSPVILMTLQMTLRENCRRTAFNKTSTKNLHYAATYFEESFEVMFVPEEEIQQVN